MVRDPVRLLVGLEPPYQASLHVPGFLALENGALSWWSWDPEKVNREVATTRGMLDAFIHIDNKEHVLDFASTYGVLAICSDGLPASHNSPTYFPRSVDQDKPCLPSGWDSGLCRDPIDRWLFYVRQARGILRLATILRQGEDLSEEDWDGAYKGSMYAAITEGRLRLPERMHDETPFIEGWPKSEAPERRAKFYLGILVEEWLRLGDVGMTFAWAKDEPQLDFKAMTFGVLAVQLATAVAGKHAYAVCSVCKRLYIRRKRMPKADQLNYCSRPCRKKGAKFRVDKSRRKKRRQERQAVATS